MEITLPQEIEERVLRTARELGKTPSQLIVERLLPAFGLEGVPLASEEIWGKEEEEDTKDANIK
jgi:hypothetical protein